MQINNIQELLDYNKLFSDIIEELNERAAADESNKDDAPGDAEYMPPPEYMYPTIHDLLIEKAHGEEEDLENFLSEEQLKIFRNEMCATTSKLVKYGSKKQWQPEKTVFSR